MDSISLLVYILRLVGVTLFPICRAICFLILNAKLDDRRKDTRCVTLQTLFTAGAMVVAILAETDLALNLSWTLIPVPPEPEMILACIGMGIVLLACILLFISVGRLVKASDDGDIESVVQRGPFQFARHPIHTSFFIYVVGSSILRLNWFFTLLVLLAWLFGTIALTDEERHLLSIYGKDYLDYKKSVGAMWPCLCGDCGISRKKAVAIVEEKAHVNTS